MINPNRKAEPQQCFLEVLSKLCIIWHRINYLGLDRYCHHQNCSTFTQSACRFESLVGPLKISIRVFLLSCIEECQYMVCVGSLQYSSGTRQTWWGCGRREHWANLWWQCPSSLTSRISFFCVKNFRILLSGDLLILQSDNFWYNTLLAMPS